MAFRPQTGTLTDLTVTGDLTVNGDFNFGDASTDVLTVAGQLHLNDDIELTFGNTDSSPDVKLLWETADADAHYLNLVIGSVSRNIIISEDAGTDWGHATSTNPTLFIQSSDATSTNDYISLAHNQTDGVISVGSGLLQLDAEVDMGANSVGFTLQTATGDGTTTIDWKLGNKFKFTFGAFNETFTFTAPSNPCNLQLILVQDSVGSRTATWPATVKWAGGSAPTLTTTATTGTDIVSFFYDGTNYWGVASTDFS